MKAAIDLLKINLQSEIRNQKKLLEALEVERQAIASQDHAKLDQALGDLARLGIEGAGLEKKRRAALSQIAPFLGADPDRLTMGEIVRKSGSDRAELSNLHEELREITTEVVEFNRKLRYLVRHYRDVYTTALDLIFQAAGLESPAGKSHEAASGVLVNTEG